MYVRQIEKEAEKHSLVVGKEREGDFSLEQGISHTSTRTITTDHNESTLVGKQVLLITVADIAMNGTFFIVSLWLVRFLTERSMFSGGVVSLYYTLSWLVGLATMIAFSCLVGKYANSKARRAGIIVSNVVYSAGFHMYQYAVNPIYLQHLTVLQWVYKCFLLVTGIVTQIAIAESAARRIYKKNKKLAQE